MTMSHHTYGSNWFPTSRLHEHDFLASLLGKDSNYIAVLQWFPDTASAAAAL